MSTLFAFLHHLCAFTLVAALAIEFTLIRQELTLASARRFFFEKGGAYYWHSHAFLTKFGLFVIIGLLSIIPTLEFLSWRGAIRAGQAPAWETSRRKRVTMVIHAELAAVVIILLCAAIMARGGWV
jgi:putative membrane protein